MYNLSLTACSFTVKQSNSRRREKIFQLNKEIRGNKNDISFSFQDVQGLFIAFFEHSSKLVVDKNRRQTFSCEYSSDNFVETDSFKMIFSKIQSGQFGTASSILDHETLSLKLKKTSKDIDMKPFYVFVIIPKDDDNLHVQKGMLIFQNVGQYGVKTITTQLMQSFFVDQFGITLTCKTIAPELFVKKVIRKDNTKKLIMVKNVQSSDDADPGFGYGKEVRQLGNLRFNEDKWSMLRNKIQFVAGGKHNLFEFESKQYDTLKVVVDIGGRLRTIDLHNLDNLSIIEAIPDEIRNADGHADEKLLIQHIITVANEYLSEMVLSFD